MPGPGSKRSATLEIKLKELGRQAREDQVEELLLRVKRQAQKAKALVSEADFKKLVEEVLGGR